VGLTCRTSSLNRTEAFPAPAKQFESLGAAVEVVFQRPKKGGSSAKPLSRKTNPPLLTVAMSGHVFSEAQADAEAPDFPALTKLLTKSRSLMVTEP